MIPRILHTPLAQGECTLTSEASHHLISVLRLRDGEAVTLFDGQGTEAMATVTHADRHAAMVCITEVVRMERESPIAVTVVQALCTGDKMDWVVQKSTELGASRIIPIAAQRSVLKLDPARAEKRVAHWRAIAQAAAAQSGRTKVPDIPGVIPFADAISQWASQPGPKTGWLLDPFAKTRLAAAPMQGAVTVMIGPEAGWSDDEESLAVSSGMQGVQMGPRILRTETAAAVTLTAIAMKCGEF